MQLLLGLDGGALDGEAGLVVLKVGLEACDVLRGGGDLSAGVAGEDHLVQEVRKRELGGVVHEVGAEDGDAPGAAFARP